MPIVGYHPDNPKYPLLDWDVEATPFNCKNTWELIGTGRTKGIFQLESQLGQQWAKKIAPENVEEISAIGALMRPGCLRSMIDDKSMTQHYADRKNGREQVALYHPAVDAVLEPTYGVLTYQEQAMRLCVSVARFNEQEADGLRKAIGKKIAQEMAAVKRMFIEKAKIAGIVTEEQADEIFGWIEKSQRYSFNKSHAVAYGIEGYWCAYAKYHATKAFFCSWLRNAHSDTKPKEEVAALVNDAKLFSIEVKTPDFRNEENNFHIKDGLIRVGIGNVKGIGESVLESISLKTKMVEALCGKQRKDWNWMDMLILFRKQITSPAFLALINSGAFSYLGMPRTRMVFEFDKFEQLNEKEVDWFVNEHLTRKWTSLKEALTDGAKLAKGEGGAARSARGLEKMKNLIVSLDNPGYELQDLPDFIASQEEQLIGCPITYNRIDSCETALANCTCKEFVEGCNLRSIIIAAEISDARVNTIKTGPNKGKKMAFLKIYDGSCALDNILLFSEGYGNYGHLLIKGNTVLLDGYRSKDGAYIVNKVDQI